MKIVLLGDSQVGKTSIISRIADDNNFEEETVSTIGAAFITQMMTTPNGTIQLQIWDTAGQEQYRSMTPMYYRSADVILFVFDLTQIESFQSIQSWIQDVQGQCTNKTQFVLVGNKTDLPERAVTPEDAQQFCNNYQMSFYKEVSAKTGFNIYTLFQQIAEIGLATPASTVTSKNVSLNEGDGSSHQCC